MMPEEKKIREAEENLIQSELSNEEIAQPAEQSENNFYVEVILAGFFAIVSGFYVWQSFKLWRKLHFAVSSAGTFPLVTSSGVFLFSILILGQMFLKKKKKRSQASGGRGAFKAALAAETPLRVVLIALIAIVYIFLMPKIGYVISTFLFMMATMLYLNRGNIRFWHILGSAACIVAAYYIVFVIVFKVRLP